VTTNTDNEVQVNTNTYKYGFYKNGVAIYNSHV